MKKYFWQLRTHENFDFDISIFELPFRYSYCTNDGPNFGIVRVTCGVL